MTDVIHLFVTHVERIIEIENSEDNSRHRQHSEEIDASPWIEKYGGKFIIRGGEMTHIEGNLERERVVVIEFPDQNRIKGLRFLTSGSNHPHATTRDVLAST